MYIFVHSTVYITVVLQATGDRILERYQDKSLQSFPPCYSPLPLQLCLEISISSYSPNLLQFLQFSYGLYSVTEKGGKPDTVENHTPFPMVYEIHTETSSLITLKIA
jgi:hypothetical protein